MIDANNGAMRHGAVLELHSDGLAAELNEEADEFHVAGEFRLSPSLFSFLKTLLFGAGRVGSCPERDGI